MKTQYQLLLFGMIINSSFTSLTDRGSAFCTQLEDGLYPNHGDTACETFLQCVSGVTHEMSCPPGIAFNPTILVCDWPSNFVCHDDSLFCASLEDGFYDKLNDPSCTTYFSCSMFGTTVVSCPGVQVFNPYTRACVSSNTYSCAETSESTTVPSSTMADSIPSAASSFCTVLPDGNYAALDDPFCQEYIICASGTTNRTSCTQLDESFSTYTAQCVYTFTFGCAQTVESFCYAIPAGDYPAMDDPTCEQYLQCDSLSSSPTRVTCPSPLAFNPVVGACDDKSNFTCDYGSTAVTAPTIPPDDCGFDRQQSRMPDSMDFFQTHLAIGEPIETCLALCVAAGDSCMGVLFLYGSWCYSLPQVESTHYDDTGDIYWKLTNCSVESTTRPSISSTQPPPSTLTDRDQTVSSSVNMETTASSEDLISTTGHTVVLTDPSGYIMSPGYGYTPYSPLLFCVWLISGVPDHVTEVAMDFIELEGSDNCTSDYVLVEEENGFYWSHLVQYCGTTRGSPRTTSGDGDVRITFESDESNHFIGFKLQYKILDQDDVGLPQSSADGCGQVPRHIDYNTTATGRRKQHVKIHSVGYVSNKEPAYTNSQDCRWHIEAGQGQQLDLFFAMAHLQNSEDCLSDYIDIRDGPSEVSPRLELLCGYSHHRRHLVTNSSDVYVKFVTDSTVTDKGFALEISTLS